MNIILFGPPGAGKGTQAQFIVKKHNYFQLSTGNLLREEANLKTVLGSEIEKLIKKFDLDPNQSILIEDIAHNLEQAKNLGMKTCWLENDETFAKKDSNKPYIDYKIKNLPSFLQEINILKGN